MPGYLGLTLALLFALTPLARAEDSLDEAYRILSSKRFVDLTHAFGPTSPVWSGFGQATFSAASDPQTYVPYTLEKDGFRSTIYTFAGQYGTHVDPPAHFSKSSITLDKIPLKDSVLPLIVLDSTPLLAAEPNHAYSVDDIKAWEKAHGRIPAGSFVALRTDLSKDWGNPEKFKRSPFPAWSLKAVQFLFEQRKITAIGHESLDTDTSAKMEAETYVLSHGHYQIEVLANLDQVPARGALIVVTWPKVLNGLGFPARAFAIVP